MNIAQSNISYFHIMSKDKTYYIDCTSSWIVKNLDVIEKEFSQIKKIEKSISHIIIDVSALSVFDSGGMVFFISMLDELKVKYSLKIVGESQKQKEMYKLLFHTVTEIKKENKKSFLFKIGQVTLIKLRGFLDFLQFVGLFFTALWQLITQPSLWRPKEIVYHIGQSGVNAVVIVGLTAFLVGMVIAYQGSVQLAKFGAEILIVDTVGLSITRELAPMITAIVIAGRSGSAYTAEIGAMKITEELSAMRTMGFDPYHFLVLPRVFALMISLPLLIFLADILGIAGGMVATYIQLDLSPSQFLLRLHEVLGVEQYYLGMIKGPVFALMIAWIGCFRGFSVLDTTQSIGLQTTASVVNGIFMVILLDALFSVLYTELGFDFI